MASLSEALQADLAGALQEGDAERAEQLTRDLLDGGVEPLVLIKQVVVPTLTVVGQRFQDFEIYLPELMLAGEAARRATSVIEEAAKKSGVETTLAGTVVLGTVEGDVHDIGKNIVGALLTAHGFRVIDIGRDVKPSRFLTAADESGCDIVAISALMTTTLPAAQRTLRLFAEQGGASRYCLIVGGGAVTKEWSQQAGAAGYAPEAAAAVALCKLLMEGRRPK